MTDEARLLAPWTAPFGLPPYGRFAPDDFRPAFEQALAAGYLSGLKARLILSLVLRAGPDRQAIEEAFAVYA